MRIITVEEHFSMPGTSAMVNMGSAAGALNASAMDTGLVDRAGLTGLSIDDDRVAAMDAAGIDVQVLSTPEERPDRVRETNDYLHDAVRKYPGLMGHRPSRNQVAPAQLDRVEIEAAGEPVQHSLGAIVAHYPMNTNSAMLVHTGAFYPFYIAPILFPRIKWLGLGPVIMGILQAVGQEVIAPSMAGGNKYYSPGFVSALLLNFPIGLAYIRALNSEELITRSDWIKAIAYNVAFVIIGVGVPQILGRDKNSPYAFEQRQMGRYDTPS